MSISKFVNISKKCCIQYSVDQFIYNIVVCIEKIRTIYTLQRYVLSQILFDR